MIDKLKVALAMMLTAVTCSAFASQIKMPTQAEMKRARNEIRDLVSVGTSIGELMSLAEKTNSGAEKYCLYVEVFKAYATKEQYADAAEIIKRIKEEISGVPESEIVKLIDQHAGKSGNKIPELKAIYQLAHSRMKAEKFVLQIKAALRKNPKDQYLQKSLGEALAISGNWENALSEFAKCGDEVSACAKAEAKGELNGKLAAFWWEYKADRRFGETGAFKAHAAELYAKLMNEDKLSVIECKVAEKRISYVEEFIEVEPSKDSSTSELAKLSRMCNTKGLLHCWRFNGDLKDCVTGGEADLANKGFIDEKQLTVTQNAVLLGDDIIPRDVREFTIELWGSYNQFRSWAEMVKLADDYNASMGADNLGVSWGGRPGVPCVYINASKVGWEMRGGYFGVHHYIRFMWDHSKEYHMAFVQSRDKTGTVIVTYYIQEADGSRVLRKSDFKYSPEWSLKELQHPKLWVGAPNSYNEVRIWNRALSEEELTQNAIKFHNAGETVNGSHHGNAF